MYKASPTLSPTAAKNFEKCTLSFRLNKIDKILFPPSPEAAKGILVHKVLQTVYDQEPNKRILDLAFQNIKSSWEEILKTSKSRKGASLETIKADDEFFQSAKKLIENYFQMEDPSRIFAVSQEQWVRYNTPDVAFLGQIDRVDKSPGGEIRIVDYKTGKSPNPRFLDDVIFQLRFYAYLWDKNYKAPPQTLTLFYLKDGKAVSSSVSRADIKLLENEIVSIWGKIKETALQGSWEAKKNPLCDWCEYKADFCPVFGGKPPELKKEAVQKAIGVTPK
jgi:putative RecB family exonuclease